MFNKFLTNAKIQFATVFGVCVVLVLVVALAASQIAKPRASVILSLSHTQSSGSMSDITALKFKELLEKNSNGTMSVTIYPNSGVAAGDPNRATTMLTDGTLDLHVCSPGNLGNIDQRFTAFWLPFIFADRQQAEAFASNPEVLSTIDSWLAPQDMKLLDLSYFGARQISNNVREIVKPEDLKGIKFRVSGNNPVLAEIYKSYGVELVNKDYSEVAHSLQVGEIEGLESPVQNFLASKFFENQKYLTLWDGIMDTQAWIVGNKTFQKLTPEQQAVLTKTVQEVNVWRDQLSSKFDELYVQTLKQKGVKVTTLSTEERAEFIKASAPAYAQAIKTLGADTLNFFFDNSRVTKDTADSAAIKEHVDGIVASAVPGVVEGEGETAPAPAPSEPAVEVEPAQEATLESTPEVSVVTEPTEGEAATEPTETTETAPVEAVEAVEPVEPAPETEAAAETPAVVAEPAEVEETPAVEPAVEPAPAQTTESTAEATETPAEVVEATETAPAAEVAPAPATEPTEPAVEPAEELAPPTEPIEPAPAVEAAPETEPVEVVAPVEPAPAAEPAKPAAEAETVPAETLTPATETATEAPKAEEPAPVEAAPVEEVAPVEPAPEVAPTPAPAVEPAAEAAPVPAETVEPAAEQAPAEVAPAATETVEPAVEPAPAEVAATEPAAEAAPAPAETVEPAVEPAPAEVAATEPAAEATPAPAEPAVEVAVEATETTETAVEMPGAAVTEEAPTKAQLITINETAEAPQAAEPAAAEEIAQAPVETVDDATAQALASSIVNAKADDLLAHAPEAAAETPAAPAAETPAVETPATETPAVETAQAEVATQPEAEPAVEPTADETAEVAAVETPAAPVVEPGIATQVADNAPQQGLTAEAPKADTEVVKLEEVATVENTDPVVAQVDEISQLAEAEVAASAQAQAETIPAPVVEPAAEVTPVEPAAQGTIVADNASVSGFKPIYEDRPSVSGFKPLYEDRPSVQGFQPLVEDRAGVSGFAPITYEQPKQQVADQATKAPVQATVPPRPEARPVPPRHVPQQLPRPQYANQYTVVPVQVMQDPLTGEYRYVQPVQGQIQYIEVAPGQYQPVQVVPVQNPDYQCVMPQPYVQAPAPVAAPQPQYMPR